MAIRTTVALVRAVMGLEPGEESSSLSPFIETANSIVTDKCVDTDTYTYTAAKLELIERWLSAHFYTVFDGQTTVEQVASLRQQYAFKIDLYLNNTKYGQVALSLDVNGALAAYQQELLNGKRACRVTWLGRPMDGISQGV